MEEARISNSYIRVISFLRILLSSRWLKERKARLRPGFFYFVRRQSFRPDVMRAFFYVRERDELVYLEL